ncbi:MAG: DOMON-like domain-containing protein [Alteraurantiacibacter sp.]
MQTHLLVAHPACPPAGVSTVEARWGVVGAWLQLRWRIEGAAKVVLPAFAGRKRADDLWQTTCCEMFLQPDGAETYVEFNFSPSEAWAAYDFNGWRQGMAERSLSHDPVITPRPGRNLLIVDVAVPLHDLPALPAALSLTAVIEEQGGTRSFWAMAHGNPERPDFHDPACFGARLAPPEAP